ncbi:MAG: glycosyltransferase family 39 protein [Candidatus Eremiobacteraeota bacterium]|nr:glycosyltransferase family 39 protein [Candidatus Eremiobacteraeota bacterium]
MSKNLQSPWTRRVSVDLWTLSIALLLALGFVLRAWRLSSMPPAVHPDEMAGLVGVLDELQRRAPLRPFFDYRIFYLPLYGIGEYISSLFFGYNAAAYRFPAVIYGLVTIVCTIGLTYRLTKNRLAALCAGVTSAILPWEITVSRIAWEDAAMLPFLLGGLWALRAGIEDSSVPRLALAGALLGIDAYSYRAALPDALILAAALLAIDFRRAMRTFGGILAGTLIFAVVVAPLIVSVLHDPAFFWRDYYISTFREGITSATRARFIHNYFAHFDLGPLFFRGDGNPQHGPAYGVLYLWMLPMMAIGLIAGFSQYGAGVGIFLLIWLLLYPLGGALTNDGIPHFLRTLAGAPLAAILSGIGLAVAWKAIEAMRYARVAAAAFALLVFIALSQFCQAYFIGYLPAAADAYQYENRDLFLSIRAHVRQAQRICFKGLNDMNSLTLFSYYLRDVKIPIHERMDPACLQPGTLAVVQSPGDAPPDARLMATIQAFDGRPRYSIFLTKS